MSIRFLRAGFLGVVGWLVAAGCGGKVAIDSSGGSGGNGGAGGTTTATSITTTGTTTNPQTSTAVTTSVTVGPTTGVGPSCGCDGFCKVVESCGFAGGPDCMNACAQVSAPVRDCVCMLTSCDIKSCFQPGTGPGPGSTTSTGGGPDQPCIDCVNESVTNTCATQAEQCSNNPQCVSALDCQQSCGWNPPCKQKCADTDPMGAAALNGLLNCAVCQACGMQCAGTQYFNTFCFLPP
jgi:hypothetical protein